jgi:hypothetical protein
MAQNFKHNKKRNTGLVYEFLVRRLSQAMLESDKETTQTTLGLVRKYYDPVDGPLYEEKELFDVVKNTRGVSESVARQVLKEVQKHSRAMDARQLDIKKSNLIKEINYSFGKDFWESHRVPDYRLLASIQMVVDASRGDATLTESVSKIQLEEGLVQYMSSKGGAQLTSTSKGEIDQMVMRMVAKRFEEKYSKALIGPQKKLLEKYIRYQVTGDDSQLAKFLEEEAVRIGKALVTAKNIKEIVDDPVMSKKLQEVRNQFMMPEHANGARSWFPTREQYVEEVMMYQKLVEEVESDE